MKQISVKEAVGNILCHDITQIIKDVRKGVLFKKGHIITSDDIPILLANGKEHIYVWKNDDTILHENEAAEILYSLCENEGIKKGNIQEGKIEAIALQEGCLKIDTEELEKVNMVDEIMIATLRDNTIVKPGDKVAGMRVIPLVIAKEKMRQLEERTPKRKILKILPFKNKRVGIVTTGSEIFKGRIKDEFGPVIRDKLRGFKCEIIGQEIVDDSEKDIIEAINKFLDLGADIVICTGGMSVDADDVTPRAIKQVAREVISYGAPVLPGAMLMVSYLGEKVILGLPGCVMYAKATVFDLILPSLMTDQRISKKDIVKMGHGGLCKNCDICHYPNCSFGK
ncbi:MAG: molybdopterin-binding protein [Candidatus Epulonipiscioides saccharophilum]|nr:MAG: molybdopterin-binding protein [Epulopiscium sp. AS2M-Bin001]